MILTPVFFGFKFVSNGTIKSFPNRAFRALSRSASVFALHSAIDSLALSYLNKKKSIIYYAYHEIHNLINLPIAAPLPYNPMNTRKPIVFPMLNYRLFGRS